MEPTVEVYQNIKSRRVIAKGPLRDYIDQPFRMGSKESQCVYRVTPGCVVVDIDQDSEEIVTAIKNNSHVAFAYRSFSGRGYHCVFRADWSTPDQQAAAQKQAAESLGIEVDEFAFGRNRPWILPRETHYAHINEAAVPLVYEFQVTTSKAVRVDKERLNGIRRDGHGKRLHYKAKLVETGEVTYYGGEGMPYGTFFVMKGHTLNAGQRSEGLKKMVSDWIPIQHSHNSVSLETITNFVRTWNLRCCNPCLDFEEVHAIAVEMRSRYLSGELSVELQSSRRAQASTGLSKEVRTSVQKSFTHLTKENRAEQVTEVVNWIKATGSTIYAAKNNFPEMKSFIKKQQSHIQFVLQMTQVSILVTEQEVVELFGQSKASAKRSKLSHPKEL